MGSLGGGSPLFGYSSVDGSSASLSGLGSDTTVSELLWILLTRCSLNCCLPLGLFPEVLNGGVFFFPISLVSLGQWSSYAVLQNLISGSYHTHLLFFLFFKILFIYF